MSQTLLTVLVAILSIVTSSAVALATLLIYFRSHRKARYDAEEHHAKLEMLRDFAGTESLRCDGSPCVKRQTLDGYKSLAVIQSTNAT